MNRAMNGWKIAFFSLLTLILIAFLIFMIFFLRYFPEVSQDHYLQQQPSAKEATFSIQSDKMRLNSFIASQIAANPTEIPYMVELTNEHVQFRSSFTILGRNVPVTINFQPIVAEDGDLLLEVETFSVGILYLPVDRVLQLIYEWIELPEWVEMYPSDHLVEVKVTELTVEGNESMRFRFITFDLKEDHIELDMIVNE